MSINDVIQALYTFFPQETEDRGYRRTVRYLQEEGLLKKNPKIKPREMFYIAFGLLTHTYMTQKIDRANMVEIEKAVLMIESEAIPAPVSIEVKEETAIYSETKKITISSKVMAVLQTIYANDPDEAAVLMGE